MMSGVLRPGRGEGLRRAVAVAALRHDRDDVLRQARQDAGDRRLRLRLVPVAVHRADDLELRVLGDAFVDALGDLVVDEDAGEAADLEQLAALRELVLQVEHLVLAHLLEVDRDAPGARLRDDAVEGDDGDAGVAGLLHRAVQRVRRGGVQHDRVVALQYEVLDLRRLLGDLVLGRGEGVGGRDDALPRRRASSPSPSFAASPAARNFRRSCWRARSSCPWCRRAPSRPKLRAQWRSRSSSVRSFIFPSSLK